MKVIVPTISAVLAKIYVKMVKRTAKEKPKKRKGRKHTTPGYETVHLSGCFFVEKASLYQTFYYRHWKNHPARNVFFFVEQESVARGDIQREYQRSGRAASRGHKQADAQEASRLEDLFQILFPTATGPIFYETAGYLAYPERAPYHLVLKIQ